MHIFESFGNLISQANLESLLELIQVLKFMVNFDRHNTASAKAAQIYDEINKAFKRLIKYGQIQDISQKVVIDCFLGLLKMSIATKLNQHNNAKIKNNEAFVCSLSCMKILLKSKTQNNYIECLNSLYLVIKENIIYNSIQF
jgi:ribonuclease HII